MKKTTTYLAAAALVAGTVLALGGAAYAQSSANTELTQTITAGTLHTDIVDSNGDPVTAPSISMNTTTTSASAQTTTGTYGSSGERVYISNPSAAAGGWNLTVAATDGLTALWRDGGSETFDYNDGAGAGQLTINPAAGTITPVGGASMTGVSLGASTAFLEGTVDTITLASADATSADVWEGHIEGMGVSQTIPGGQAPGTYRISLTQTLTAQ